MPVCDTREFICDICGRSTFSMNTPGDWVVLSVESNYNEREFTDKVICNVCSDSVIKTREKK